MKFLFLLPLFLMPQLTYAMVSCAPTSCTPACNSSCTYQTCTGSATNSITIKELPYDYVTKPDACLDLLNGQVIKQIPTPDLPGVNSLPATVASPYKQCQTQTISGPPCPPPPPPGP
ncbi:hypothetical protein CIK05_05520 [Bdellovibrio sp. qaytius]|nr:hypothetical protein CIK05_05520 [Bdellovibrio sp. qaytius]